MGLFNKLTKKIEKNGSDNPTYNRKRVGKSLFFATVVILGVFALRFGMIVSTGELKGVDLTQAAKENYYGTFVEHAKRGTIYDRNGNEIAADATSYSVYVVLSDSYKGLDPKTNKKVNFYAESKNYNRIAEILNQYLEIDKSDVLKTLENGSDKYQVEFGAKGKNISFNVKEQIVKTLEDEGIRGVEFEDHPARIYQNGQFASHFIGLASLSDADDDQSGLRGQFGLEAAYDDILSGKNGVVKYEKNAKGNPIADSYTEIDEVKNGDDVYTTIDLGLQTYLETLMGNLQEKVNAKELTATLMTADTGEVLATSQYPSFNLDTKEGMDNKDLVWSNLLIQSNFEPGSTMKIFTTAAAQNEGKFNPDATYQAGTTKVVDTEINDWDVTKRGVHTLTYLQALSNSSNVGMVNLQKSMGDDVWRDYLNRFGFGRLTNSGLGSASSLENTGTLPTENVVDMAMSSYGQAINVSQVQMLRGLTSITNNGKMLEPRFVSRIVNNEASTEKISQPEVVGQPVSSETANAVLGYLVNVGTDPVWGTAYSQEKGGPVYEAGGAAVSVKTGTAEISGEGGYLNMLDSSNLLHSVIMMTPTENPKYILYLTMKQPEHYDYTAMSEVTNPLLAYAMTLDIAPVEVSTNHQTAKIKISDYTDKSANSVANELRRNMLHPVIIGDGANISKQSIGKDSEVEPNTRLLLVTEGNITMPDVSDWTKKELKDFEKLTGVKIKTTGSGKAVEQSVKFNQVISKGQEIEVRLE